MSFSPWTRRSVVLSGLALPTITADATTRPQGVLPADATADDAAAAAALIARALASPRAFELAASLTTEVGPRHSGTPGEAAGIAWALRTLSALRFENVHRAPVMVPRWVRGEASLEVLAPFPQPIPTLALGGSVGTSDEGLEAEVVAVRDLTELRALPREAVTGRFVFFSGRTERTRDGSGYGRAVPARTEGPSVAAGLGATGVVVRSIGTSSNRFPHTGTLVYNISQPRIPAVAISNPDADLLERQLAAGRGLRLRMRVTARDLPQVLSHNVIGEIPGTTRAQEIVLVGAHLDSWDPGTGALDDAAGVAIALMAARLAGDTLPRPLRTIRVVLFANEEFGLAGARRYAMDAGDDLERHAIAMESDSGSDAVWRLDSRVHDDDLPLVRQIHDAVSRLGVELGGNMASGGADLGPLRRLGVPVLAPVQDMSRYFDYHHTANDTLDKIDASQLRQAVAVFSVAAYLSARWPHPLRRRPREP